MTEPRCGSQEAGGDKPQHESSGGASGASGSSGSEERLRQLSPVHEATSSIERGSASDAGSSLASGAPGRPGDGSGRSAPVDVPQARCSERPGCGAVALGRAAGIVVGKEAVDSRGGSLRQAACVIVPCALCGVPPGGGSGPNPQNSLSSSAAERHCRNARLGSSPAQAGGACSCGCATASRLKRGLRRAARLGGVGAHRCAGGHGRVGPLGVRRVRHVRLRTVRLRALGRVCDRARGRAGGHGAAAPARLPRGAARDAAHGAGGGPGARPVSAPFERAHSV
jgi:hypothetical protein